jgi:hypothetical protein
MKKLIVLITFFVMLNGCATLRPNESWENLLNKAKKPVTVVSLYSTDTMTHVLFKDAKGNFFTIYGLQFGSLQPGYVFY